MVRREGSEAKKGDPDYPKDNPSRRKITSARKGGSILHSQHCFLTKVVLLGFGLGSLCLLLEGVLLPGRRHGLRAAAVSAAAAAAADSGSAASGSAASAASASAVSASAASAAFAASAGAAGDPWLTLRRAKARKRESAKARSKISQSLSGAFPCTGCKTFSLKGKAPRGNRVTLAGV